MLNCRYCGKECKNKNSLSNHERLCKSNPVRQLTPYERGLNPFKDVYINGAVGIKEGHVSMEGNFTRECPHCNKWFKRSQIGGHVARCSKVHNEDRKAMHAGITLDITAKELYEYLQKNIRCEICGKTVEESKNPNGKSTVKRLCIDHDHVTNHFRGVLCQACNRQLGWYEKNKQSVIRYLNENK